MSGKLNLKISTIGKRIAEYVEILGIARGLSTAVGHLINSKGLISSKPFRATCPDGDYVWLRPRSSDLATYREVFINGEYDLRKFAVFEDIKQRYESLLANGSTPLIVDAGANVGLATVFLARLFPKAEFVLIEASAENIELARRNVAPIPRAKLLNRALWYERKQLSLVTSKDFSTYSVADDGGANVNRHQVQSVTMNEIVEASKATLFILKMDIEGSESPVLRLNNDWLGEKPVILVESHDREMPGNNSLRGLFERADYQSADVILNGTTMIFVPQVMSAGL